MKRAIVTGATGMLGLALVKELLTHDYEVYAVIRPDSLRMERLELPELEAGLLHIVPCPLSEMSRLPAMIPQGNGVFFHMAWANTGKYRNKNPEAQNINVEYERSAVRAASDIGCRVFVGAGSQAEYGPKDLPLIGPDTPAEPTEYYGIAKLAAMKEGLKEARMSGISFIWMRIFSTYGPFDKATSMISESIVKMLKGEPAEFTPATQIWDYLYSEDAARAFYLAGERGKKEAVYCLGSGKGRPLKEYIQIMTEAVDPSIVPGIGKKTISAG